MRSHFEGPSMICSVALLCRASFLLGIALLLPGHVLAADVGALRPSLQGDVVALDEVVWTIEGRYWHSTGKTSYSIDSSHLNPIFGNPTSKLRYQNLDGRSGEIELRGDEVGTGLFGRAM